MQVGAIKNLFFAIVAVMLMAGPVLAAENDSASLEALRTAAEQGQVDAQYELGVLYEFGYNYPEHAIDAYVWYSRAAEQGNAAAAKRRDLLKARLSAAELERAQTKLSKTSVGSPTH